MADNSVSSVTSEGQMYSKCGEVTVSSAVNGFLCGTSGCSLGFASMPVPLADISAVIPTDGTN